jgi:twitching motility protein PilT
VKRIDSFLELVVNQKGSDLHLVSGQAPRVRLYGELLAIKYRELTVEETTALLQETMTEHIGKMFATRYNLDYSYDAEGLARFRVNVFRHLHGLGGVLRVVPTLVPPLDELCLPQVIKTLCRERRGLILVTGPTGSGKSTTLAAMIDFINRDRKGHIITIEDPIEFIHTSNQCLISQREVGRSTPTFAAALHSALREDPDAILVGELRDLDTISLAITAAETGILVLGTLHSNGSAATIDRLINVFPASDQPRIRAMLSTSLTGVISQQLVRRADGKGRLAALEILLNNPATANIIREGKAHQLGGVIERGALLGMQSLDHSLRSMFEAKLITGNEAYRKAINKTEFERFCEQDEVA